ncbi:hypothetical protein, partial [Streptacidiphilus monticola]
EGSLTTSYTIARRFRVWSYSVGHMTLVLRSLASTDDDETVDVWFDGVAAMNLHQSFEPLTIRAASPKERRTLLDASARDIFPPNRQSTLCLILESAQPDGFVVCAHVRVVASHGSTPGGPEGQEPDAERLLWAAGPTGNPRQPLRYRLYEAGEHP